MPKYLELKGQRLVCNETMPLGLMMDLAEAMDGENEMKAVAVMGKTLRTMVTKAERSKLEKMLYDTDDPVTFDDLNSALGKLIPEYTGGRPTAPPSPSAPSPDASGGISRRVSLSVVEPEPTSSKGGRRAAS